MTIEHIYSTILDRNIKKNLINSPIWNDAYTVEEIVDINIVPIYLYKIKFKGTKPTQVLNIKTLTK